MFTFYFYLCIRFLYSWLLANFYSLYYSSPPQMYRAYLLYSILHRYYNFPFLGILRDFPYRTKIFTEFSMLHYLYRYIFPKVDVKTLLLLFFFHYLVALCIHPRLQKHYPISHYHDHFLLLYLTRE